MEYPTYPDRSQFILPIEEASQKTGKPCSRERNPSL